MAYTKRDFILGAFAEMGLSSYVFDASPEDLQTALRRLDSMMSEWYGRGLKLGYPSPASPQDSDLDEQTSVPDWANEAVIANLAVRLAPSIGKAVSIETKVAACRALDVVIAKAYVPVEIQLGAIPAGAGHKSTGVFLLPTTDPMPTDAGGDLTF